MPDETIDIEEELDPAELVTFEDDDSPELPPSDIVAYNESRSCADLFRMFNQGILEIQPEFQREVVWKGPAQTRFIDSLIKQLPIPSLCFSLDYKTQRWQVIDGLQRMASIIRFLNGDEEWTLSKLDDIEPDLSGAPARRFLDEDSPLFEYRRRVENLTLPITVLRCDYSKKSHTRYLFTIFHRLNTGAMQLNNQEIRNCIYEGPFNDLLSVLNEDLSWLKLNSMKDSKGYRFRGQEMVLRFFAFNDRYEEYGGRLAGFLNNYMADKRDPGASELAAKTELFNRVVRLVFEAIYDSKAPSRIPISVLEATLVGVARNLDVLEQMEPRELKRRQTAMLAHEEFSQERLSEGLAGRERLKGRLDAAVGAFASV